MTDRASSEGATPRPEECDHKWVLKGGTIRGTKGLSLFQCELCGRAFQRESMQGAGDPKDQIVFQGWNTDGE